MKLDMVFGLFARGMAIIGLFFLFSGCAADKNPPFGAAEIVSEPPGADVTLVQDNSTLGTTPFTYVRETADGEDEYIVVKATKPGYEDEIISFFLKSGSTDEETAKENPQLIEIMLENKQ